MPNYKGTETGRYYNNGSTQIEDARSKAMPVKTGIALKWERGYLRFSLDNGEITKVQTEKEATVFLDISKALFALQIASSKRTLHFSSLVIATVTAPKYARKDFKWFTINSSLSDLIGYSRELRALAVDFGHSTYVYEDVSESIFTNALLSASFGVYYNQYLKGHKSSVKL